MSFDLKRLELEIDSFQKMPSVLKSAGFHVEVIDQNAFVIHANKNQPPYSQDKKYEIIFSGLIHGNEVAGIAVLNESLNKILKKEFLVQHSVTFCIHNVQASLQNKRFLENDLNRSFLKETNLNEKNSTLEEKLAKRAESFFKDFQYCVDFHQTNQASETPFFIFFYTNESMHWARFLDSKIPVIVSNKERHKDGSTIEFFCNRAKTVGVTIELGVVGFHEEQILFGTALVKKALQKKSFDFSRVIPFQNVYKILESIYWTTERIFLDPGFVNFHGIKKNEKLGSMNGKDYFCPHEGVILFPKYGEIAKNTKEVYTIAVLAEGPEELK